MDAGLNNQLNYELSLLQNMRKECMRRLKQCAGAENVLMRFSKKHGNRYLYIRHANSKRYRYAGCGDADLVAACREARYLRETVGRIDSNIKLIESFRERFLAIDSYSVNAALPEVYRCDTTPASQAYKDAAVKWKADRLAFQKEFPENYPEYKKESTSDGVQVKSVSEVVLHEMLISAGLCTIYELPLVMKDYGPTIYPDETVLSPVDLVTEVKIEYVGRLDLPLYREAFAKKLGRYMADGYTIGIDLFLIYSDSDGHIDTLQIKRAIADIKGLS